MQLATRCRTGSTQCVARVACHLVEEARECSDNFKSATDIDVGSKQILIIISKVSASVFVGSDSSEYKGQHLLSSCPLASHGTAIEIT